MDNNEVEKKEQIFNSTNTNKKDKKKYFRVEKSRMSGALKEKESKKIFKTQKEYHLKRKVLRELRRLKFHKVKKFITITKVLEKDKEKEKDKNKNKENIINTENNFNNNKFNISEKENNSFFVQRIIPKKIKIIKENKKESDRLNHLNLNLNYFSKQINNNSNLFNEKNKNNFLQFLFNSDKNNFNPNNNNADKDNNIIKYYKIKLMLVYFYSIKNLCRYINNNFFNNSSSFLSSITSSLSLPLSEQQKTKTIDDFIYQIYQSLRILDKKINDFNIFQHLKDDIKVNKDDFYDISSLKENLLFMKNVLNNSMSQNLINIYSDIENFCKKFSSS